MATVAPATCASAFSNGSDQALTNTAVLNAGGNIIYFEWNPGPYSNASSPSSREESLSSALSMMSHMPSFTQPRPPPGQQRDPDPDEHAPPPQLVMQSPTTKVQNSKGSRKTSFSESGLSVNMMHSHEAGFCPSLARAPSSCEVYTEKMFPLKHGYPLWFPQPDRNLPIEYRMKGVSTGDLGFITSDGAFDLLFNIWNPPHDIEGCSSPPSFQTISKAAYSKRSMLSSTSNIDSEVDWESMDISYSYYDNGSGAVLCMPHGASQEDYKNERLLEGFVGQNAESWYRYAVQCGRDLDRHSLYLVTGSLKSKSWGIVTYNTSVKERHSVMVLGQSPDPEGPVNEWKKTGRASSYRTGPVPDATTETHSRLPKDENQCLFLRGFKISLSEEIWKEINIKASIYNQNGKRTADFDDGYKTGSSKRSRNDDTSSTDVRRDKHVNIINYPLKQNLFHPLNEINDMILSLVSGSRVAITHDNHWLKNNEKICNMNDIHKDIVSRFLVNYDSDSKACTLELRSNVTPKAPDIQLTAYFPISSRPTPSCSIISSRQKLKSTCLPEISSFIRSAHRVHKGRVTILLRGQCTPHSTKTTLLPPLRPPPPVRPPPPLTHPPPLTPPPPLTHPPPLTMSSQRLIPADAPSHHLLHAGVTPTHLGPEAEPKDYFEYTSRKAHGSGPIELGDMISNDDNQNHE